MKVAFSHDVFSSFQYGGIARYHVELHRELRAINVNSTILAGTYVCRYLEGVSHVRGVRVPRFRPGRLRAALTRRASAALERRWLREMRPAIYHRTYLTEGDVPSGVTLAVTVHDMIHELFPQDFAPDDPMPRLKRRWVERADVVLVVSESTRRDLLARIPAAKDKTFVTPLGVRLPPLAAGPGDLDRFVLGVGQRHGYKNGETLLRAFARTLVRRDTRLVLFGGEPLSEREARLIDELGLRRSVEWVRGSDAMLAAYYARALALVYPSRYEGFGLPPLEAMAAGCPVIASNRGSVPEVVGNAGILLSPDDVDGFAAAIDRVASQVDVRRDLVARGLARAAEFTWERTARLTAAAYGAARPKPSPR